MNTQIRTGTIWRMGAFALCASVFLPYLGLAQEPKNAAFSAQRPSIVTVEQPDAERTKQELSDLLEHYPPTLHSVLTLDPGLLSNESYLAPYPALSSFLTTHPEVPRNPAFYVGQSFNPRLNPEPATLILDLWRDALNGLGIFAGFGLAISLLVWLIRTLIDYRRWSRLAKVQTDVHTKLLDRFTANEDLLAYIQSPAGAKFLQSSPINLNIAPHSVGAPLARILWSVQGGIVLLAGGIGLRVVSGRVPDTAAQALHVFGVLAMALGLGFVVSAILSFVISQRLGLIEPSSRASQTELPVA